MFRTPFHHYGFGEIFVDQDSKTVDTDCWADGWQYGGKEFFRWPKEKRQSVTGLNECLEIVKRTVSQAYVGISRRGDLS